MNAIIPFSFDAAEVRVITRDGDPWFVLADVCRVLDHSNLSVAAGRLDPDEKGVANVYTPGGRPEMTVISESGLYALILTSRKRRPSGSRNGSPAPCCPRSGAPAATTPRTR